MAKGQNLFVGSHKCSNPDFRDNYDRTFGKKEPERQVTNYCTVKEHMELVEQGIKKCSRCGEGLQLIASRCPNCHNYFTEKWAGEVTACKTCGHVFDEDGKRLTR